MSISAEFSSIPSRPALLPGLPENNFLCKVDCVVDQRFADPAFGIPDLAAALWVSPSQLYRRIKALTGRSPALYLRSLRLQKARRMLLQTDLTITEIAYRTGFSELAYFSRSFSKEFGRSPILFRKCNNSPNK